METACTGGEIESDTKTPKPENVKLHCPGAPEKDKKPRRFRQLF